MADDRSTLVQRMVDAGESDANIDAALSHYDEVTHPIRSALEGVVSGLPSGVYGAITGPFSVAKGVITDLVSAVKAGRLDKTSAPYTEDFLNSITQLKPKWDAASPTERGEMIGNLLGGFAGGAAEGVVLGKPNLAIKPTIRVVGKGLQYAGEHPFAARMSGGAMLATGIYHGNPEMLAGGTAAMAAPALLTKAGRAMREFAGEDLSENLPSGTRTLDVGDISKLKTQPDQSVQPNGRPGGYRVSYGGATPPDLSAVDRLPSGARTIDVGDISKLKPQVGQPVQPNGRPSGYRVAYAGANPPDLSAVDRLPSGARMIDVDASGLPGAPSLPVMPSSGGYRIASPGSPTGPAPYRPAARAAVKADENAANLDEITRRKEGMVAQPATVTDSLSATMPGGGRTSSSVRFARPKAGVGAAVEGVTDDLDNQVIMGAKPGTPAHASIVKRIREGRTEPPPVSDVEQTVEDAQRGAGGVEQRVTAGTSPTGVERRTATSEPSIAERAAAMRAEGITPPASKAQGATMVNNAVQDARQGSVRQTPPKSSFDLSKWVKNPDKGATDTEIIALRDEYAAEEAGTKLAKDPRFINMSKDERTNAIRTLAGDEAGLAPKSMQRDIDSKLNKMNADEATAYRAKSPNAVAYKYITGQMKKLGLLN